MSELKEVSREEAEKIWDGQCPICGGKLMAGSRGGKAINVMCEYGCKKFSVPSRPALPQRI